MDGTTSSQEESVNDLDENSSVSTIQSSSREVCRSVEIQNEEQGNDEQGYVDNAISPIPQSISLSTVNGEDSILIPPNSFALASSLEYFRLSIVERSSTEFHKVY